MLNNVLFASIIMAISFLLRLRYLPPQIPLFYSRIWGENQLGELWMISLLPVLMIVIVYINSIIPDKLFRNDTFIKKIFYYLDLLTIIVITLIFMKIIFFVS